VAGFRVLFYLVDESHSFQLRTGEDMGTIFVNVSLPPLPARAGTAIENQVDSICARFPQVAHTMRTLGQNYIAGNGSAMEWSQ